MKTHNTEYSTPHFYDCDAKETFPIDLPVRVEGDFGGNLGTFVLFLHHSGRVTEEKFKKLVFKSDLVRCIKCLQKKMIYFTKKRDFKDSS